MPKELHPNVPHIPASSEIRGYRYLSCQGGGAKGTGFVGAAKVLEKTGVLSQIEEVAGTSAGGLFALLLAIGCTADEIEAEMATLDFRHLQDKDSPAFFESTGLGDLLKGFSGTEKEKQGALEKFQHKVAKGLSAAEDATNLLFSRKLGLWKGEALFHILQRRIAAKTGDPNITFKGLAKLAEANPGVFRKLTLTGSNLTAKDDARIEYYNEKDWPDMPIALAARISAGFPFAFMPVIKPILKRKGVNGEADEYSNGIRVDGGLLQNLPVPPNFRTDEGKVSKEVLALSFKDVEQKDSIESSLDLARSLYRTKMYEGGLRKEFGDNIVYIDTQGVETLDFELDENRRKALVGSGSVSVEKTLSTILQKEKKLTLERMSLKQLLRYKAELLLLKKKVEPSKLLAVNEQIEHKRAQQKISREKLQHSENQEFEKLKRTIKVVADGETIPFTEDELIKGCKRKLEELERIKNEQTLQIKELRLIMSGFDLRRIDLEERLDKKDTMEWVNTLESHLAIIKNIRERMRHEKIKLTNTEKDIHILREKHKDDRKLSAYVLSKMRLLEAQKMDSINKLSDLNIEKDTFINGALTYYRSKKDDFICHMFQELRDEFKKPMGEKEDALENARFPKEFQDIIKFIEKEQEKCENYLQEAKLKRKQTEAEIKDFQKQLQTLERRHSTSSEYNTLKTLQKTLTRSVYEKTTFIGKVNDYFVSDRPSLKNNIVTGVMQFVAFAAFTTRVALTAAVGAATLPYFIYKVVNLVKNYNGEGKAKAAADRFLRAFGMPNLFARNKLKYLLNETTAAVAVLENNYDKKDETERAYVYKLYQLYFNKTMKEGSFRPTFEDLFPRNEDDTKEYRAELIQYFESQLDIGEKEGQSKTPIFKNIERFHAKIQQRILEKGAVLKKGSVLEKGSVSEKRASIIQNLPPSQSSQRELHFDSRYRQDTRIRDEMSIDLEFIKIMDKLIQTMNFDPTKTLLDLWKVHLKEIQNGVGAKESKIALDDFSEDKLVLQYITAAKKLDLKLPVYIQQQFIQQLERVSIQTPTETINIYAELADHFQITPPENFKKVQKEYQRQEAMERKGDQELHSALQSYYQKRRADKKIGSDNADGVTHKPPRLKPTKDSD